MAGDLIAQLFETLDHARVSLSLAVGADSCVGDVDSDRLAAFDAGWAELRRSLVVKKARKASEAPPKKRALEPLSLEYDGGDGDDDAVVCAPKKPRGRPPKDAPAKVTAKKPAGAKSPAAAKSPKAAAKPRGRQTKAPAKETATAAKASDAVPDDDAKEDEPVRNVGDRYGYDGREWYCCAKNDTVESVAKKFGYDAASLLKLNVAHYGSHLKTKSKLKDKTAIEIPDGEESDKK